MARVTPAADPLTNLQLWASGAGEPGILPRLWLRVQARPRRAPQSPLRCPRRRPGPAPGVRSSRGAQPRVQRTSAPPGPVADATRRQRSALLL
ncbi:hypothetical protein NDU88_006909 [Pleurodeles waltl]|uniref:Uncharacterized protein n=1 Tax=Pleurodeles waltl TaxID=8319 RepID=A0AAV7LS12_PLEWA|nr:hypothetical protein NDU88_006909 [Pleurodeles waltl]